jgi:hypothetical protein
MVVPTLKVISLAAAGHNIASWRQAKVEGRRTPLGRMLAILIGGAIMNSRRRHLLRSRSGKQTAANVNPVGFADRSNRDCESQEQ